VAIGQDARRTGALVWLLMPGTSRRVIAVRDALPKYGPRGSRLRRTSSSSPLGAGLLAVAAVRTSLYPAGIVQLPRVVLHERLPPRSIFSNGDRRDRADLRTRPMNEAQVAKSNEASRSLGGLRPWRQQS
jgi:hypothetical protein